jgi:hypothetical protein
VRSSVPVVEITDQVDGFASGAAGKGEGDAGDFFALGFYEGFMDHRQAPLSTRPGLRRAGDGSKMCFHSQYTLFDPNREA